MAINDFKFTLNKQCTEVIENKTWHPKKNTIYVPFTQDTSTRATYVSATSGRNFTLIGSMLKIIGPSPSVGITLTSSSNIVTKIPEDMWAVNAPSKLIFLIPAGLADGEYTLTVTTQYCGGNKILLKIPKRVEQIIYIGQAPAGGGGRIGGDDNENPLG